jgi:pimeloyl-ACP methyl ester carboxylesterase
MRLVNSFTAVFIPLAGHWPQQEQAERVAKELLKFISSE